MENRQNGSQKVLTIFSSFPNMEKLSSFFGKLGRERCKLGHFPNFGAFAGVSGPAQSFGLSTPGEPVHHIEQR